MTQQTLTDHDPVTQAQEWGARDSVAAAYERDWSVHLVRFHTVSALSFWADSGTVPEHVADDYREQ